MSMEDLQEELELWKKKCEEAQKQKRIKNVQKIKANEKLDEIGNEHAVLEKRKKQIQEDLKELQTRFNGELLELQRKQISLSDEKKEFQQKLDESEKAHRKIQQTLMVNSELPKKNINFKEGVFIGENRRDSEPMDITYTCQLISGRPYILEGGEALLTFEDEQVAKSVIAKKKHSLEIQDRRVTVDALEPPLPKSVKFEVNMNISRNKINISKLPNDIPEEILKDKVELAFYKSNIGGAEIEKVDYNKENNTACVTYLQKGVAQRVLKNDFHMFMAGETLCEVGVTPCVNMELNKLQMSSAVSPRSVLLTGIKNSEGEPEDDVQDMIQIHFQKESHGGGEVESIIFSEHSKKTPIFEMDLV